jgi:hypothetical protein
MLFYVGIIMFSSSSAIKLLEYIQKYANFCKTLEFKLTDKDDMVEAYQLAANIVFNVKPYVSDHYYKMALLDLYIIAKWSNLPRSAYPTEYMEDMHDDIKFIIDAKFEDRHNVEKIYKNFKKYRHTNSQYLINVCEDAYKWYNDKTWIDRVFHTINQFIKLIIIIILIASILYLLILNN